MVDAQATGRKVKGVATDARTLAGRDPDIRISEYTRFKG
jgi:hypothetical protein